MATSMRPDTAEALHQSIAMFQILVPQITTVLQQKLSQGIPAEAILKEVLDQWEASTESMSAEENGALHLFRAISSLGKGDLREALESSKQARQEVPELSLLSLYLEGQALTLLQRYDDAWDAFKKVEDGLPPYLPDRNVKDVYQRWSLVGLAQGLEGASKSDITIFEIGVRRYISVLERAYTHGLSQALEEVVLKVKQSGDANLKEAVEEFELGVRLLSIKDPFERWREFTKEISKVWPKGVSAVDAIREQRK